MADVMSKEQRELWNVGPDAYALALKVKQHWRVTDKRASRIDGIIIEIASAGQQSADFSPELKALLEREGGIVTNADTAPNVLDAAAGCSVTRGPGGRSPISLGKGGFTVTFDDLKSAVAYYDMAFSLEEPDNSRPAAP